MQNWNIKQLERAYLCIDLPACHTSLERAMARAIHGREVRELAEQLVTQRKLTPGEAAIAEQYGYKEA